MPNNGSSNDAVPRRSANFPPTAWGDYFLNSHSSNTLNQEEEDVVRKQVGELKEEVRNMFVAVADKCSEKLRLIDLIQRLGLSYHFEEEINEILEHTYRSCNVDYDEDLYMMALRFRLLRQQGYFVECEIFNKFRNEMGVFKESIVKDERGLLSLYEASHLRMNEENILDEALAFTTAHLQEIIAMDSSSCFAEEIKYALKWPIFKAYPRLMSNHYISLYNNDPLHNNDLLTFAMLDYNLLQKLYQKELAELSRWMIDLKIMEQLSFARDRTVENFVWALGAFYEPKYSRDRILLAKIITLLTVLDDTYDVYATLDELESFTNAIERWDINDIEELPNYMKFLYGAIFNLYREIEQDICKEHSLPFALDYAKDQMKGLCKAYLMEAKWYHEGYVPSMEEYMKVATVSISIYVYASISFLHLKDDDVSSKEVYQWANSDPMLLKAAGVISRLMNDITSHKDTIYKNIPKNYKRTLQFNAIEVVSYCFKDLNFSTPRSSENDTILIVFEQERGHVASAVECYVKQYGNCEEKEVVVELEKLVDNACKDLTQDYIKLSTNISNAILVRILNIVPILNLFYKKKDSYTLIDGATKSFITTLFIHPI